MDLQKKWALVGAEARLKEVQAEIAEIYRVFPELRSRRVKVNADEGAAHKRRRFSAKGKAAISEGMRKYWARRKAQAAKVGRAAKS
jgi:seryl-tRNA synthetase